MYLQKKSLFIKKKEGEEKYQLIFLGLVLPVGMLGTMCTTTPFKQIHQNRILRIGKMMIVGQVSSAEEAKEIEAITKSFVVGNRARALAMKIKKV